MNENILDHDMAMPEDQIQHTADSIEELLQYKEEILWEGAPVTSLVDGLQFSKKELGRLLAVILWPGSFVLGLFAIICFSLGDQVVEGYYKGDYYRRDAEANPVNIADLSASMMVILGSLGLLIFIIVIGILVHKYQRRKRVNQAKKLAYYLTNTRIIFRLNIPLRPFHSIPLKAISNIRCSNDKQGNGTLYFVLKDKKYALATMDIRNNEQRLYPTWELQKNVGELHKLLVEQWRVVNAG